MADILPFKRTKASSGPASELSLIQEVMYTAYAAQRKHMSADAVKSIGFGGMSDADLEFLEAKYQAEVMK